MAQAAGIGEVFGALMGKHGTVESASGVDDVLVKLSAKMNANLPAPVDSDTRLDQVTAAPGQHLIYHYTLVNFTSDDIATDDFDKMIKPRLKTRLCESAEMRNFLKNGVTISYLYKGKDGKPIGGAKFEPRECGYGK